MTAVLKSDDIAIHERKNTHIGNAATRITQQEPGRIHYLHFVFMNQSHHRKL